MKKKNLSAGMIMFLIFIVFISGCGQKKDEDNNITEMDVYKESIFFDEEDTNTYISADLLLETMKVPYLPYTMDVPSGTTEGLGEFSIATEESLCRE